MISSKVRHGAFLILEKMLRWVIAPGLRAAVLRTMGASVGKNVRIYECQFINLGSGFCNLAIEDDVHIGSGCLIDLQGIVKIKRGSTLSPRVILISHNDPGSKQHSPLLERFPCDAAGVEIGEYCWIGTGATILSGSRIGSKTVVGALSLVKGELLPASVYVGVPAKKKD